MRWRRSALFTAAVFAASAGLVPATAEADRGPVYEIDEADLADTITSVEAATGQVVLSGEIAGAAWIAQVPENWNGDLVVYAHGYRGEGTALTVDPPPEFQFLVDQGFAWAASSYRRNSYDPGVGVIDTKNITRHMQSMLGRDLDKTYLTGFSMGGHVTVAAIEKYPNLWDGALPACGVLGDVELFDYFLDYNVGSAALAGLGSDYPYPDADWLDRTVPDIKSGLSNNPGGQWGGGLAQIFGAPSPLTSAGQTFKDFVEVGSGGDRVTYDAAWYFWHGLASATGDFFFGFGEGDGTIASRSGVVAQNSDMTYGEEYGPEFGVIDRDVKRITAANRVRNAQGTKPAPIVNGTPSIPVLAIHTTGDLFVPIEMERIYAREVIDNGRGDLLVQRAIRDIGHCSFTGAELRQAYSDLFEWVENGVKPAGEDLVNDISSPDLGCEFTVGSGGSGLRFALEPCP
jgi:pimeloyl-ACP methyl ester carboxylesterase